MHDEERPALEQAHEEDLDLEGAETTVLSTPYGETTGVRRPPVLSAPTPDAAAGGAPAPAAASADDIVADVVALTPDFAVSADDAPDLAVPAPDDAMDAVPDDAPAVVPTPDFAVSADDAPDLAVPAPDDAPDLAALADDDAADAAPDDAPAVVPMPDDDAPDLAVPAPDAAPDLTALADDDAADAAPDDAPAVVPTSDFAVSADDAPDLAALAPDAAADLAPIPDAAAADAAPPGAPPPDFAVPTDMDDDETPGAGHGFLAADALAAGSALTPAEPGPTGDRPLPALAPSADSGGLPPSVAPASAVAAVASAAPPAPEAPSVGDDPVQEGWKGWKRRALEAESRKGSAPGKSARRRWPIWVAAAALLFVCALAGGGYAYASHYATLAVPGTTVAGVDVAGMSREQIVSLVQKRAAAATVTINGDVSATATLADLGTTVDAEATADAAMTASADVVDRFKALVTQHSISVVITSDQATAETYTMGLIPDDQAKATDAAVVLADDGASFTTTPGSEGVSLDTAAAAAAATQAATSLQPQSITLNYMTQPPTVSEDQARTVADQANRWVEQDVTIKAPDGKDSFTADAATKASWITVTSAQGKVPTLSVDSAKVSAWVQAQSEEVAEEPVNGERNVNSSGAVVGIRVEAVNGTKVTNVDALTTAITRALSSGSPYSGAFETEVIEATWKDKTIADGAENLIYQAAPGEKWIDINLSNKTVTAYEGATVVHGPVSIVDGAAATPTVTGTYHIYLKHRVQTMQGENADGSTYVTEDVPWVSYFYSGYAFHGAPWRSSFGYSGSHGCINMPVSEAEWIYNWAEEGTTVVSH